MIQISATDFPPWVSSSSVASAAYSTDGKKMWCVSPTYGYIYAYDMATFTLSETIPLAAALSGFNAAVSLGENFILSTSSALYLLMADGAFSTLNIDGDTNFKTLLDAGLIYSIFWDEVGYLYIEFYDGNTALYYMFATSFPYPKIIKGITDPARLVRNFTIDGHLNWRRN
jgi:hypothetical protein